MIEYGDRTRRLPAPPHVVWDDLAAPKQRGVRAWLHLLDDEVPPAVVSAERPVRLVWSSLWPSRPDDHVVLELTAAGTETAVRFVLLAAGDPPSPSLTGHLRKRMNQLLYGELRSSYDN